MYSSMVPPFTGFDSDRDGTPDYLDADDDGDGIDSIDESPDPDQDGVPGDALDFDKDGVPDYLDTDDEDDGVPSKYELTSTSFSSRLYVRDSDRDDIPDYHDLDDDGDGVPTSFEITSSSFSRLKLLGITLSNLVKIPKLPRTFFV